MMIYALSIATILLACHTYSTEAVCGHTPTVWRNNNITCPERAVCADKFETIRDWYNGTRCHETRVLSNCICAGNQVCPYDDESHMLYSSGTHKQYMCTPVCRLPWCENISFGMRGEQAQTRRPTRVVAVTAEQNAVEFGGKTYYKLSCRCPRNHFPVSTGRRSRAVRAWRHEYNWERNGYSTQYICSTSSTDPHHDDPCPRNNS